MTEEIEQIFDILWKITIDVRNLLCTVQTLEGYDKYDVDNWRTHLHLYHQYEIELEKNRSYIPEKVRALIGPHTQEELLKGEFVSEQGIPSFLKKRRL